MMLDVASRHHSTRRQQCHLCSCCFPFMQDAVRVWGGHVIARAPREVRAVVALVTSRASRRLTSPSRTGRLCIGDRPRSPEEVAQVGGEPGPSDEAPWRRGLRERGRRMRVASSRRIERVDWGGSAHRGFADISACRGLTNRVLRGVRKMAMDMGVNPSWIRGIGSSDHMR